VRSLQSSRDVLAIGFWKLGSFGKRSAELKAQKAS
jgi:hypothetical protein